MNIQQKVLQMASKKKEKESQKAVQESTVDKYEEIQKNLTEEQKRLISKYFPRLVNILTQKEEDVYNLCKRYDFNEKVLDDYVNVIVIKSKEHSSEYGEWVEVTSRMKLSFPNKDEKAKKDALEAQNKDEKPKDKLEEEETSGHQKTSKRNVRKSYHDDPYYEAKEEDYGNYTSSRRNKYQNGYSNENYRYSRSQGRPHREDYYYEDEEEDYSRGQRGKKKVRTEKRVAKSPEPRGRVVVEYVRKTDSNAAPEKEKEREKEKAHDENIQENKKPPKKSKKQNKGDVVVYYVKKEDTDGTTQHHTETTEPSKTQDREVNQKHIGARAQKHQHTGTADSSKAHNPHTHEKNTGSVHHHSNTTATLTKYYKEMLRGQADEEEEEERKPNHQQQQPNHHHQSHHQQSHHQQHNNLPDKKIEKELEKMERERQAEKDRLEKLEREIQHEKDRLEKLERQNQLDRERLEKERLLELEREKEKYQAELARIEKESKKNEKRKNFAVQQISHYVPKNVSQGQFSISPSKIESISHNLKPEQDEQHNKGSKLTNQTQTIQIQQQPIILQPGLQTPIQTQFQQQPMQQQQIPQQQQPVLMQPSFPFMTPYFPYFPQMQMPTDPKDIPMMSPMQTPFIVIPQANGTSIIQPLYNMPNMTQPTTTTIPPNVSTTTSSNNISNQTQTQKSILQFNQTDPNAYTRVQQPINSIYGSSTEDSNMTKSRSMPTQTQNSFFNVGDKSLDSSSLKNTQSLFNTNPGYFSMSLNQQGSYDPRPMNFFKPNDPNVKKPGFLFEQ